MPVESADYISELNPAYPAGTEFAKQGANHLRLIKQVLQNCFPGLDGPWTEIAPNWTTPQTITLDSADVGFTLISEDDSADFVGPILKLFRDSASPAALDVGGSVQWAGRNSSGDEVVYGSLTSTIVNPADGAEGGALVVALPNLGILFPRLVVTAEALQPAESAAYDLGAEGLRFRTLWANRIELGNDSDTTLYRSSAGVVAVEGTPLLRANQNLGDVANAVTAFGTLANALPGLPTASPNSGDLVPMYAAGSTGVWRADSPTNALERMFRGKFGTTRGQIIWNNGTNWVALNPPGGTSTMFLAIDSAKNVVWALPPP